MNLKSLLKPFSNLITLLLAICGCVISIVLTVEHYQPKLDIGCGKVGGDCKTTVDSAYGHIGPIPTSLLGLGMYGAIGGLCCMRFRKKQGDPATLEASFPAAPVNLDSSFTPALPSNSVEANSVLSQSKRFDLAIWGIALLGTGISLWLQYVSLGVILSFCPWCMTSAVTILLIFLFASRDLWLDGKTMTGEQKLLGWVGSGIFVMLLFIFVPLLQMRIVQINHGSSDKPAYLTESKRNYLLEPKCHYIGSTDADAYTLIEYADYQCGACKTASKSIPAILKSKDHKLRFSFRNFPLERHDFAQAASQAAEAAAVQGKYMEMHDMIYEHQPDMEKPGFNKDSFAYYAKSLNLDLTQFNKDFKGKTALDRIAEDKVTGEALGVDHTPTFFLVSPKPEVQSLRLASLEQLNVALKNKNDPIWK